MIDNREVERILTKLENMEDEEQAVILLKEFNYCSSHLGKLLLNLDKTLSHEDWKKRCDEAQKNLDTVLQKIDQY